MDSSTSQTPPQGPNIRHVERGNFKLKFLDRYVGILAIVLLRSINFRRRSRPATMNSIGILTNAAIGDTILLSAVWKDIRSTYPHASIVVYATRSNLEICEMLFGKPYVVLLDIFNPIKSIRIVRNRMFDVFVDMGQWTRLNALMTFFSRSKYTIGFRTKGQYKHYLYDEAVDHRSDVHELHNFQRLATAMGVRGNHVPIIQLDGPIGANPRSVVVHVAAGGTRSYLKQWPAEHWAVVVDHLTNKGYDVTFSGTTSDLTDIDDVVKRCRPTHQINIAAGKYTLVESAALLARSFLVISVDTGIMHLAAALQCNLISLHGPSPASRWGPLNSNSITLASPYEKAPCLDLGFEFKCGNTTCCCMGLILPSHVIDAIGRFETGDMHRDSTSGD